MKKLIILFVLLLCPLSLFAKDSSYMHHYHNGEYTKAVAGLSASADKGDKKSLFYLGKMYFNGLGVVKNQQQGLAMINKSANAKFVPAELFLANYYLGPKDNPKKALYWYEKAAEHGDRKAQLTTATAYYYGHAGIIDKSKAKKYFLQPAFDGNAFAQYHVGLLYMPSSHSSNRKLGFNMLVRSANKGNSKAQYELGKQFYTGQHLSADRVKAIHWLTKAAVNKNKQAAYWLGKIYLQSDNGNTELAIKWLEQAASQDMLAAKYQLGLAYLKPGKFHDAAKAFKQIKSASKQGSQAATYQLAKMYEKGVGVSKDEKAAFQLYMKAANNGFNNASRKIGIMYYEGIGVNKNKEKAILWLKKAIDNDDHLAKGKLEQISANWNGLQKKNYIPVLITPSLTLVEKKTIFMPDYALSNPQTLSKVALTKISLAQHYQDHKPTLSLPRKVTKQQDFKSVKNLAQHGDARSQYQLSMMYQYGLGTKKDLQQAAHWLTLAAETGYQRAEYRLGGLYLTGTGVEKDYQKALKLLNEAAFKGDRNAQYVLGFIYEHGYGNKAKGQYIAPNLDHAAGMYNLAANAQSGIAEYQLARLYSSDVYNRDRAPVIHDQNLELARSLFQKAAKQNVEQANIALASFYMKGSTEERKAVFDAAVKQAEQGDKFAQLVVGIHYDRGIGVEKNSSDAIYWYKKSAEQNALLAQYILGTYYYLGEGVSKDQEKGIEWLNKAAKQNFPAAHYHLALIAAQKNNKGSNKKFLQLLKHSAKLDHTPAHLLLADYYLMKSTDRNTIKQQIKVYQDLASKGNPKSQLKLGYMYQHGIYFPQDYAEASQWYSKAAISKDPVAQYLLGNLYQTGKGVPHDLDKAFYWYEKSAKNGYQPGQIALAYLYETDKANYQQAKYWYEQAVDKNNTLAQYNLALLYQYGKGIEADPRKAFNLIYDAAQKGLPQAQYSLAHAYLYGIGVRQNERRALNWYEKSAAHNNPLAMYQLGLLHESGVGTAANLQTAMHYYKKAAQLHNKSARLALVRLSSTDNNPKPASKEVAIKAKAFDRQQLNHLARKSANYIYMLSVNDLNSGKLEQCVQKLKFIMDKSPNYQPAKRLFERLI